MSAPVPVTPGDRLVRPVVIVLALASAAGLARIATVTLPQAPVVAGALAVGTAVVAVYGFGLAMVIRALDRWRTLRAGPVLVAAAWGGLIACPLAGIANTSVFAVLEFAVGPRAAAPFGPPVVAPLVEETLKLLGVLVALVVAGRRPSGPLEAMMLGAVAGLGFQLSENLDYLHDGALWSPLGDGQGVAGVLVQRIPSGINGHWVYTALAGLTVGLVLCGARRALVVLPLLGALALHALNNGLAGLGLGGFGVLVDLVVGLTVLALVHRWAALDHWRRAVPVLASEPDSVCDDDGAAALRSRRTARKARRSVRREHGRAEARRLGRRQRGQLALASAVLQGRPDGITDAARRAAQRDPVVVADG